MKLSLTLLFLWLSVSAYGIVLNGGAATATPPNALDFGYGKRRWFEVSLVEELRQTTAGSGATMGTDKDANVNIAASNATFARDYLVTVNVLQRTYSSVPTLSMTAGGNVTLETTPQLRLKSIVNNGTDTFTATTADRTLALPITASVQTSAGPIKVLTSWVTGSLGKHTRDAISTLAFATAPPSPALTSSTGPNGSTLSGPYVAAVSLFTTRENGTGNAVRSSVHWLNTINLSAFSTYSTTYGAPWGVTAITARHVVNAAHGVTHGIGSTVWFCSPNGTRISSTITNVYTVKAGVDLLVYTLNADLPSGASGVTPMGVLPANWPTVRMPGYKYGPPLLYITQDAYVCCFRGDSFDPDYPDAEVRFKGFNASTDLDTSASRFAAYYLNPRFGDSGNPIFTIIFGEPKIISVFHTPFSGANISNYITEINAILDDAGSYSLNVADLSSFNSYP
jgi:hypothetical protein